MRCPYCDAAESRVVDTTTDSDNAEIRRRRLCQACGRRYTTVERIRAELPLVRKDGPGSGPVRSEPFDPEKLRRSILIACAKRPIAEAAIDRLIAGIEARLRSDYTDEVSSRVVGEMVIDGLRELDEVACIRYSIVFLPLSDLAAVQREIDRLLHERERRTRPVS
jgi:transcriptional repressor NrdR